MDTICKDCAEKLCTTSALKSQQKPPCIVRDTLQLRSNGRTHIFFSIFACFLLKRKKEKERKKNRKTFNKPRVPHPSVTYPHAHAHAHAHADIHSPAHPYARTHTHAHTHTHSLAHSLDVICAERNSIS